MAFNRRDFLFASGAALVSSSVASAFTPLSRFINRSSTNQAKPRRLIIDADPGVDDTVSILLALKSREVSVEALTVVAGNVEAHYGTRNALTIVEVAGRTDIPVALGAERPLMRTAISARPYHGANGFGNVVRPEPKNKLVNQHAMDLIISRVKASPGAISILSLGPLTNIALALMKDPSIAPQIAELAFMGGTVLSNGNVTPVATFNIYADPEAARIAVNSGIPKITMVGTDVTTKVKFTGSDFDTLDKVGTPVAKLVTEMGRFRLNRASTSDPQNRTTGFNDLSTTVAMLDHSLFTIEPMKVDVETKGELTTGMTVANKRNIVVKIGPDGDHLGLIGNEPVKPNVDVATGIQEEKVRRFFLDRVGAS
jgi:inosine-uridine nucleoside N-ribohydrolase